MKPADPKNMSVLEDWMIPRQVAKDSDQRSRTTRCMIEVQNDAMHDRNSDGKERTYGW